MDEMRPGQVISPAGTQPLGEQPQQPAIQTVQSQPTVAPDSYGAPPAASPPQPALTTPASAVQEERQIPATQPYQAFPGQPLASPAPHNENEVPQEFAAHQAYEPEMSWSASEYIGHEKSVRWYAVYLLGLLGISAGVYLFTRDVVSTAIVLVALTGLLFLSLRKPRIQDFSVDEGALSVGSKVYYLHDFKSFSLLDDGSMVEVTFLPLKRFMPPISVYVQPDKADMLAEYLADYIPHEQRKTDSVDTLLRRIRF